MLLYIHLAVLLACLAIFCALFKPHGARTARTLGLSLALCAVIAIITLIGKYGITPSLSVALSYAGFGVGILLTALAAGGILRFVVGIESNSDSNYLWLAAADIAVGVAVPLTLTFTVGSEWLGFCLLIGSCGGALYLWEHFCDRKFSSVH